jgi:hypothetical protein
VSERDDQFTTARPLPASLGFATDALVFAIYVILIEWLEHAPGLLAALLAGAGFLRLRSSGRWSQVLIFAIGALAGAGFDLIRVGLGTYEYAGYALFPPFMPLLWGQIGLTIDSLLAWSDERSATEWSGPLPRGERAATVLSLFASLFGLPLVDDHAGWAIAIFLGCFVAFVAVVRRAGDLQLGLSAAALGPLAELALVSTGLYEFDSGRGWGLPLWLPTVWPLYALVLRRARGFIERRSRGRP